ncbi:MAG: oxaloacetate decarboxylase [Clostridiales bacterium]|nr:oxaloacetate decarboxylase [Clostridiales bacterium]
MKKIIGIVVGIIGVVLSVLGISMKIKEDTSVAIIGGADGPTATFVAGKLSGEFWVFSIMIGLILMIAAGIVFFKHRQ